MVGFFLVVGGALAAAFVADSILLKKREGRYRRSAQRHGLDFVPAWQTAQTSMAGTIDGTFPITVAVSPNSRFKTFTRIRVEGLAREVKIRLKLVPTSAKAQLH